MGKSGLVAVCDRAADGGPVLSEGESFALLQPGVSVVLGESDRREAGTLYVTTRRLVWLSDEDVTKGYGVDFIALSMHAISRDPEAYSLPCIYTQIENGVDEYDELDNEDDEASANGHVDLSKVKEMRLVPADPAALNNIFQVLCECAALNPDPEGEQDGEGEWFFNADEVAADHRTHDEVEEDDPRFQDAEEDEHSAE